MDGDLQSVDLTFNPRARRYILRLDRKTGHPRLTVPPGGTLRAAEQFLQAQIGWLSARLAQKLDPVPVVPGALIPIRAVPHHLVSGGQLRGQDAVTTGPDGPVLTVFGDPATFAPRTIRFLKKLALSDYEMALARHAAILGKSPKKIRLTDTRSRWGSCSSRGTLNLSWRLIMAPPPVLDYLAAHEISHLLEMNHSARFWAHVETLCPDYKRHDAWLSRHGPDLWRYG